MNSLSVIIFAASITIAFGFQSFAQGGYQFPGSNGNIPSNPGIGGSNDRGTWNIGVNKDKGRGPQIHADGRGNIYTSPNGNWQVDAGGRWDAGRGRKPSYGGDISVTGRWRRAADPFAPGGGYQFPGNNGARIPSTPGINGGNDRGTWNIGVNKDKGRGPQIHADGRGNIYTSPGGNVQVDAGGRWEAGRGRKPTYGGDVSIHGRIPRAAEPGDKGSIQISGSEHGVQAQGTAKVWESDNGRSRIDANANVQRYGGRTTGGGGLTFTHRFKREADVNEVEYEPEEDADSGRWRRAADPKEPGDRGSVSITREQTRGQKPVYTAQGNAKIWESRDKRGRVEAYGNAQRQHGRTNYGGGVQYTHRFRRDADLDEFENEPEM